MTPYNEIPSNMGDLPPPAQKAILEKWFRNNYEDPAIRTPYISKEGGYQWIWGGPYDAREELAGNFEGIASDGVIEELAEELALEQWQWAPVEDPSDYEDQFLDDILHFSDAHRTFTESTSDIKKLSGATAPHGLDDLYYRMLFAQIITSLETYLFDTFVSKVLGSRESLRKYVESTPEFKELKISLSKVLSEADAIETTVKKQLTDVIWHNLSKVKNMYKDTLDVIFPSNLESIYKAIQLRHDIIHRNGKNKNGELVPIVKGHVDEILSEVEVFVLHVEAQLRDQ